MTVQTISKTLSANDTGETGGHQSGLLIPLNPSILSFFPKLDKTQLNPRVKIRFEDQSGKIWNFTLIYYNNKHFGGTRNEYRLTHMTKFIREAGLKAGDEIIMSKNLAGLYQIAFKNLKLILDSQDKYDQIKINVSSNWKIINI